MKHFLTSLLFFIGLTSLAQPTYLDLFIQFDQYPNETSWLVTQGTDTVYTSPSYDFQSYVNSTIEQRLFLEAGVEYKFYMNDAFGDGICCGFGPGYFTLENACDGLVIEDLEFGQASVDYAFTLAPCIPPILTADVTFRVDLANAPPGIETPGVLGSWNGWQVIPMTLGGNGIWFVDVEVPLGNHLWKFADFNNPEVQELPAGVNDSPCFQFDEFGFVNRTLNITAEEEIILPPYCWESCLPCGGIAGCSNPNAINWSPWANFDDGSCIVQNTDCPPGETIIEIVVTPDNFGGETSWKLFNDFGEVAAVNPGEYGGSPPGIPISTFLCVPLDVQYDLVVFDTYGDGLCASCATNNPNLENGNVQIFDCEGTELYNLLEEHPDGNFGYDTVSPQFLPTECGGVTVIEGCTDSDYIEYNPEATNNDGSCLTPIVFGCLDETAYNWDPEANTEDEIISCDFTLTIKDGVGDGWFGSWLGIYQFGTIFGSPQYQMGPEDGTEVSFNIELSTVDPAYVYFFVTPQSIATAQQCGFTLTNPDGEVIIDVPFFSAIPFVNESGWYRYEIDPYCGNTCIPFIEGCQNPTAINYNDEANFDDGSCYFEPGCTQAGYLEYYTQGFEADFDNGDCQTLAVFGCTDPDAFNFDEGANVDNETCVSKVFGCTNELAFNYNPLANTDDGSCVPIIEGCTNQFAFNFEEDANTDDGSCIAIIEGCTDEDAFNYNFTANTDDGSCVGVIEGCTDENAFNFNLAANTDDGSCIPVLIGCTDSTAFNYNELANTDFGCIPVILGCIDQSAVNYNEFNLVPPPNTDDGSCFYAILGCIEEGACNYNELANTNDGTCEYLTCAGCTSIDACNYNPTSTIDNGTCEYPEVNYDCDGECLNDIDGDSICDEEELIGCTDDSAFNFIESATDDDGSCLYDAGCSDTPGEPYWLNDVCFAWVINDVTPGCCGDWSESCQGLYNLCQENGIVTSVEDLGATQIVVFPNPTQDILNIVSNLNLSVTLYNTIGQPVIQQNNPSQIDISNLGAGIYHMILDYNGLQFTKKIIKQ